MTHLSTLIESSPITPDKLIEFAKYLLTSSSVPLIVGRQALEFFVLFLCGGSGVDLSLIRPASSSSNSISSSNTKNTNADVDQASSTGPEKYLDVQELEWFDKGHKTFEGEQGEESRETIVRSLVGQIPTLLQPGGWGEDQVRCFLLFCSVSSYFEG
jgi:hypothetical protein